MGYTHFAFIEKAPAQAGDAVPSLCQLALSGAFFLAESGMSEMPGRSDNDTPQQVRPVSYDLADLVSCITPQNLHPEHVTKPVGRERT